MERAQRMSAGRATSLLRLPAGALVLGVAGCTLVGSPQLAAPGATSAGTAAASAADVVPRPEAPSPRGNMAEYEQGGRSYRVLETSYGYDERGVASWYGRDFQGRPTSSGETFDMNRISAAHRTLPLPSWVEVTNLTNGRRLVVRINDRGPFHDPDRRIIDLSYAAAVRLGIDRSGTAAVRVRAIEPWQYRSRDEERGGGAEPRRHPDARRLADTQPPRD